MKKNIPAVIFLVFIIGLISYSIMHRPAKQNSPDNIDTTETVKYPSQWSKVDSDTSILKLEKEVESGIKPQISLTKGQLESTDSPQKYLTRLISGAKSAIPSLRLNQSSQTTNDDLVQTNLSGYYYNQKLKVNLLQRVYIKQGNIAVITASYSGNIDDEINQIFDQIYDQQIKL